MHPGQADETRWNVFETTKTKSTFNWYLWVFASLQSVVYVIDPTRSAPGPQQETGTGVRMRPPQGGGSHRRTSPR
ncbi:MAG: IS66 family transposase [Spirochaetia bacterium]